MLMLRPNDFPSVSSRILLACLGLQLLSSACTKEAPSDHKPAAMADDASVAADGGEQSSDAGTAQEMDAAADAAAEEVDASQADASTPREDTTKKDAGKPQASEPFDLKGFSSNLAKAVCDSLR